MAVTRLIAMHKNKGKSVLQSLSDRTDYAMNPEKTEGGLLVTGYECDPEMVKEEFLLTKRRYEILSGRWYDNEVIAYQIRQSFRPGEVTPEEANEIGRELALRFTKGNYAFIVATHTDRAHIHNHIIFNSTRLDGKRKFRDFRRSGLALQKVSDLICLEHGLSVITPRPYGERSKRTEYPKQTTIRDRIMADMETILETCPKSFEEFVERLKASGYEIKTGKHIAVKGKGQERFVRLESLREGFRENDLRARIGQDGVSSWEAVRPDFKVNLLIDVQEKLKEKGIGYAKWATVFNLKQMAKTLLFLRDHGIESMEQLDQISGDHSERLDKLLETVKASEKRLSEITELRRRIVDYIATKKTYAAYRKAGYSDKFLEENREEITRHRKAKEAFEKLDAPLPTFHELDEEYKRKLAEKRAAYSAYRKERDRAKEVLIIRENLRSFYRAMSDPPERTNREEKQH